MEGKKSLVKVGRGKNGCALGRGKNGCALPCPPSAFCTTHIYNLARKQALSKCTSMWYTNHYTAGITAKPTYHTCITGTTRKSVYQSNTELKWKAYQSAIHASCVPLPPQWPILKETKRNIPCTSFKQQHSSARFQASHPSSKLCHNWLRSFKQQHSSTTLPSLTPILQTTSQLVIPLEGHSLSLCICLPKSTLKVVTLSLSSVNFVENLGSKTMEVTQHQSMRLHMRHMCLGLK